MELMRIWRGGEGTNWDAGHGRMRCGLCVGVMREWRRSKRRSEVEVMER